MNRLALAGIVRITVPFVFLGILIGVIAFHIDEITRLCKFPVNCVGHLAGSSAFLQTDARRATLQDAHIDSDKATSSFNTAITARHVNFTNSASIGTPQGGAMPHAFGWMRSSTSISSAVQYILSDDPSCSYAERRVAVRMLGYNMHADDVRALMDYLENQFYYADLSSLEYAALKNDILDILIEQKTFPDDLGSAMLSMYEDSSLDVIWRNYVVQHFAEYYMARWPDEAYVDRFNGERVSFERAMWAAVRSVDSSIGASALLSLMRVASAGSHIESNLLVAEATRIASDESAGDARRISAIQVAAQYGSTAALHGARGIVASGVSIPLQLSAISYLGRVGGLQDLKLIHGLQNTSNTSTRLASALSNSYIRLLTRLERPLPVSN